MLTFQLPSEYPVIVDHSPERMQADLGRSEYMPCNHTDMLDTHQLRQGNLGGLLPPYFGTVFSESK